jgi:hypothetical protein
LNEKQRATYERLLSILCYKNELDGRDLLSLVYHMLLQDRYDEASTLFERFKLHRFPAIEKDGELAMQSAYVEAYLDFCFAPENTLPEKVCTYGNKYII